MFKRFLAALIVTTSLLAAEGSNSWGYFWTEYGDWEYVTEPVQGVWSVPFFHARTSPFVRLLDYDAVEIRQAGFYKADFIVDDAYKNSSVELTLNGESIRGSDYIDGVGQAIFFACAGDVVRMVPDSYWTDDPDYVPDGNWLEQVIWSLSLVKVGN